MKRLTKDHIVNIKHDRANGMTVPDLVLKYQSSKGAVWHHVKNVYLSDEARNKIQSRRGGSKLRSENLWKTASKESERILEDFDENESWPALLTALYWGEGTKRSGLVFTNTDHRMIRVFMKIMRERFSVKESEFDILIRTCKPMHPILCRKYWSNVVDLPFERIRINHNDTHNKSKTTYGMCRITIKQGGYKLKVINCMIQQIADKILAS